MTTSTLILILSVTPIILSATTTAENKCIKIIQQNSFCCKIQRIINVSEVVAGTAQCFYILYSAQYEEVLLDCHKLTTNQSLVFFKKSLLY